MIRLNTFFFALPVYVRKKIPWSRFLLSAMHAKRKGKTGTKIALQEIIKVRHLGCL